MFTSRTGTFVLPGVEEEGEQRKQRRSSLFRTRRRRLRVGQNSSDVAGVATDYLSAARERVRRGRGSARAHLVVNAPVYRDRREMTLLYRLEKTQNMKNCRQVCCL
ncbi:hypothetical protein F2P81_017537 [Scophthalmus maximus]|uniref:Uncharacterized protein n=1 Tax=Scophthalmus maximus TaxID=52904 RepID=A0A6A4S6G1_SCOMX|nr:hypothetical protein F2P81_017537 [Scophthalmus maximus]